MRWIGIPSGVQRSKICHPMNSPTKIGLFLAIASGCTLRPLAVTVNDGSTITNLVQISNSDPNSQSDAVVHLDAVTNSVLQANQSGTSGFFALRSAWYATNMLPTGGVYTVTADFQPGADTNRCRGGVMGWLNLGSSNGISFHVRPGDSFQVSVINFTADNGFDNEGVAGLFNLDGTPATEFTNSAGADLGTNYSATNFATFQLAFSMPTSADLAAVPNATAHI